MTVGNVAPVVEAGPNATALEGSPVSFSGGFTDPGALDSHGTEWTFGDGGTATGSLAPTHVYADDGVYTVTLAVADDDGGVGGDTLTVTVTNVAPVVAASLTADVLAVGETRSGSGTFVDPGADGATATVDYGDGAGAVPLTLAGPAFGLTRVYSSPGRSALTAFRRA